MQIIGVKIENRTGEDSDFQAFNLSEVNYISVYRRTKNSELLPVYHTIHGGYAPLLTLKDISQALQKYGFDYIDKSTIVNRNRIKRTRTTSDGQYVTTFVDNSEIAVAFRSRYR
ncbi:LytTr DNA-binding domain protein [compost metagenome]